MSTRVGSVSGADPEIAAQMAAITAPWPDAIVIDTETGDADEAASVAVQQALTAIRPHGPEYV